MENIHSMKTSMLKDEYFNYCLISFFNSIYRLVVNIMTFFIQICVHKWNLNC
jgi:hypothetical protein